MRKQQGRTLWMPGLLMALLALVGQVALAGPALPQASEALADNLGIICHVDAPGPAPANPAPHHRAADCMLCPLCTALAAPGAILASGPLLPAAPMVIASLPAPPPQARAPPGRKLRAAYPRGPPAIL